MAWKNPSNGRTALYIASHAYAIEGMEQGSAQKLLAELMDGQRTAVDRGVELSHREAQASGDRYEADPLAGDQLT